MKLIIDNPMTAMGLLVVLVLTIVAWAVIPDKQLLGTTAFKPTTYDGMVDILMPILVIALLVERAVQVFISTSREIGRDGLDRRLEKAQAKIIQLNERSRAFQSQLDSLAAERMTEAQKADVHVRMENVANIIPSAQREERDAQAEVDNYRSKTGRLSFFVSAVFGFVVGLAGMRVLTPMVLMDPVKLGGLERFAFFGLDVVLTAALIAGGASGIHQIISVFRVYTEQTRSRMRRTS